MKKATTPALPPLFRAALLKAGLPLPVPEYRFHPERKWRWDFAWCIEKQPYMCYDCGKGHQLALEVQGGIWSRGAHGRGTGITRDMEKFSEGAALGWRLLLVTPNALCSPATMDLIRRALDV